ncbi:MFS multidrug transporter [Colletotrichum plurivorum]|uniref:MFS multidrug transporter n=1 Tax=Colletotrichum plurivorum TaxID=2175906 RepID=A0A8H6NCY9_9PEZI|nr:MFS multidrug transporter [Colletotrichum plurivorum]
MQTTQPIHNDDETRTTKKNGGTHTSGGRPLQAQEKDAERQPTTDNDGKPSYVTGYKLILAIGALTLSAILINLDSSILSTATPTITNEFHSVKDIGWYVSSYQLAVSALQPMTGKLFTYFSNKARLPWWNLNKVYSDDIQWTYISFLVLFEAGSLICGLAKSSPVFIAGRAVSGVGASGLFNGSMIIVYGMVPAQTRPFMMGLMLAISQIGMIAGPLIGGSLTQYTSWRWCFWINLPVGGLACFLLASVYIPEHIPKPTARSVLTDRKILQTFDVVGSTILIGTVVQLLLALHFGGSEYSWSSPTVVGLFCGFGAAAILFIGWEYRAGPNALIPLELFLNRVLTCGALMNLCASGLTYIATYFIPIFFQSILGDSPMESGIHMLPSILSSILFTVLSGTIVSKLGYYLPWAIFAAVITAVGCGLMSTWSVTTGTGEWIGYQILYGSGRGLGMQLAIVAIQTVLPPAHVATALTILVFIQGLGISVLISIGNAVFDSTVASEIEIHAPGLDPRAIIKAGATAFRSQVPPQSLADVVKAWAVGYQRTMYIATGLSVGMFLFACGLGLYDARKKSDELVPESKDHGSDA